MAVFDRSSRYVKPPIVYGDVYRPAPMTVETTTFAASCTGRPMKGMLTGPVTILNWSFVREDQPRDETCRQIALAVRDEVCDLEAAGVGVIQVDEPALREGMPLRRREWADYLRWAVACFRLSTAGVRDEFLTFEQELPVTGRRGLLLERAEAAASAVGLAAERYQAERARDVEFVDARRTAYQASLIPIINSLFAVGLVALPGMMTGQILSGVSPLIAAKYQIVVMTMLFGVSGMASALYLRLQK